LPQTNTAERLRAAAASGVVPPDATAAAVAAFYFIQGVRLRHQGALESFADDAANRINPNQLNELDRRTLKEAFRIARDVQARLALDYQL
jgi:CBS domain-containing protein